MRPRWAIKALLEGMHRVSRCHELLASHCVPQITVLQQVRFAAAAGLARSAHAAAGGKLLLGEHVHIAEPAKRTSASAANTSALKRMTAAHGGKVWHRWPCHAACLVFAGMSERLLAWSSAEVHLASAQVAAMRGCTLCVLSSGALRPKGLPAHARTVPEDWLLQLAEQYKVPCE